MMLFKIEVYTIDNTRTDYVGRWRYEQEGDLLVVMTRNGNTHYPMRRIQFWTDEEVKAEKG